MSAETSPGTVVLAALEGACLAGLAVVALQVADDYRDRYDLNNRVEVVQEHLAPAWADLTKVQTTVPVDQKQEGIARAHVADITADLHYLHGEKESVDGRRYIELPMTLMLVGIGSVANTQRAKRRAASGQNQQQDRADIRRPNFRW